MMLESVSLSAAHHLVTTAVSTHGLIVDVVACDPTLADTAAFCDAYGVAPEDSANTIVVIGKGPDPAPLAACLVLATTRLDVNSAVKQRFGTKKASFSPQELACEVTGMEYGGVTAVGLPATIPLWIDAAVMSRASIIVGGGNRSTKLRLDPRELLKLPNAAIVEGLAKSTPAANPAE
jgi:prolyl-tRNA editing enzyme YbaK/EbsC (Cys-tRNA(Pro) deacylase)